MNKRDKNELADIRTSFELFKKNPDGIEEKEKKNLPEYQALVFDQFVKNYYMARDQVFESFFSVCDTIYNEYPFLTRDLLEKKGMRMINTEESAYPLEAMFRNFVNGYDIEKHILMGYINVVYDGIEKVEYEYQT